MWCAPINVCVPRKSWIAPPAARPRTLRIKSYGKHEYTLCGKNHTQVTGVINEMNIPSKIVRPN